MTRCKGVLVGAAVFGALLAGCGGGSDDGDGATEKQPDGGAEVSTTVALPEACEQAPLTMELTAGGEAPAGNASFAVTDAVARRVAILPGAEADPTDVEAMDALAQEAGTTELALYTLYLADFDVARTDLTGSGFGVVVPGPGRTVGALTIVPSSRKGFAAGDVVDAAAPEDRAYQSTTTFSAVGLTVYGDGDSTGQPFTDISGMVEVVALSDRQLCLAFDLEVANQGKVLYTASGTVGADVVRAADSFFFT